MKLRALTLRRKSIRSLLKPEKVSVDEKASKMNKMQ
jgi:hypothetical protein